MPDQRPDVTPASGTLYVVATPIGHLGDLSPRAQTLLEQVAVIAAEDTRTSQKLVPGRAEPPRWIALHDHNEARAAERVVHHLLAGDDVALVSDAGTPLISDPGYRLVAAAHDAGVTVLPVPGPCAAIAALSASGLPSDRFRFEGFLPPRRSARRRRLVELADVEHTLIFYVPARDLVAVIDDLAGAFGPERPGCIARELTKQFESVRRDRLDALSTWTAEDPDRQRGEAVLLVAGAPARSGASMAGAISPEAVADALADELAPARAAKVIRALTGLPRADAFALAEARRGAGDKAR
ncbi:16S rRNA (cytidine(1402)-2'-O)-methyltransferase [Halomonas denitrificans]|nr:16S rRNA (cytidine(1402)-2'-O)-methyltransferase [Halomonas denitrificans]